MPTSLLAIASLLLATPPADAPIKGCADRLFDRHEHFHEHDDDPAAAEEWLEGFGEENYVNDAPGWKVISMDCDADHPGCGAWESVRAETVAEPTPPAPPAKKNQPTQIELWSAAEAVSPAAGLQAHQGTAVEALGRFGAKVRFEWSTTNGVIDGEGARVNWTPDHAGPAEVEVCVRKKKKKKKKKKKQGKNKKRCFVANYEITAPSPRVVIDEVLTQADLGFAREISVSGHVEHLDPQGVSLTSFVHSDVMYFDGATIELDPNGQFTYTTLVLNPVDRINVTAHAPGVDPHALPGCNQKYCIGRMERLSGHEVPSSNDGEQVFATGHHYLRRDHSVDAARNGITSRMSTVEVEGSVGGHFVAADAERRIYYAYDQAVVALGLIATGDLAAARTLLDGLAAAQGLDGSWPAIMAADGSPYDDASIRYAGANAWVLMAFNAYHFASEGLDYLDVVDAGLDYLETQRQADSGHFPIRFNPVNVGRSAWDETRVHAFEHQADAMAAFYGHGLLTGNSKRMDTAADLRAWMEGRWNGAYFNPGTHLDQGENESERYLDTQTWGLLALGGDSSEYVVGLKNDCNVFFEVAGYREDLTMVGGFSDFAWSSGELPHGPFVWSEGTLGYIAAADEVSRHGGETLSCSGVGTDELYFSMQDMLEQAWMPMASTNAHPDYTEVPSSAALAWWLLVEAEVNPFRPWEQL